MTITLPSGQEYYRSARTTTGAHRRYPHRAEVDGRERPFAVETPAGDTEVSRQAVLELLARAVRNKHTQAGVRHGLRVVLKPAAT